MSINNKFTIEQKLWAINQIDTGIDSMTHTALILGTDQKKRKYKMLYKYESIIICRVI